MGRKWMSAVLTAALGMSMMTIPVWAEAPETENAGSLITVVDGDNGTAQTEAGQAEDVQVEDEQAEDVQAEAGQAEDGQVEAVQANGSGFLPVKVVSRYLDYTPESVKDRLNEYGQLPTGSGQLFCNGGWEEVGVKAESLENYPALAQRLSELSSQFEENGKVLLDATWEGAEAACSAGYNTDEYAYYNAGAQVLMCRADEEVLSFMRHDVWFAGGPYSEDSKTGWSIDPATGEDLKVSDVYTDTEAAYELLKTKLEEYFTQDSSPVLYENLESYFQGEDISGVTMTVGYENVVFYIAPTLTSRKETVVEFLPYSELKGAVNERYTGHQTNYVTDVICDPTFAGEFSCDLDQDGSAVKVLTYGTSDEYDSITGEVFIWSGQEMTLPIYALSTQGRLVRTEDGNYYFYIDAASENDWHQTYVMNYKDGGWGSVGDFTGGIESRYEYEEEGNPYLFLDPNALTVDTRAQTLSTVGITRTAKVGGDGMPAYNEKYWEYSYPFTLTLKIDLEADLADDEGNITGTATLPAGTKLYMYRTDEAGNEFLRDEEGTIYHIELVSEDWPRTVNGVDIEETFDGLMFAG